MLFPGIGNAAASLAATNTALTAVRIATKTGGSAASSGKFAGEAETTRGEWEGVQCCPSCLEPITESEKWAACCSRCGYTEHTFILTKTRARRRAVDASGHEFWEWKDSGIVAAPPLRDILFYSTLFIIFVVIVASFMATSFGPR